MDTSAAADLAALLDQELAKYASVPGLVADLKVGAGFDPGTAIKGQDRIVAYDLSPGDELFVTHLVTATRFVRHERNTAGDTLTVVIPLSRIARVSVLSSGGEVEVKVEYDADQVVAETSQETFTAPVEGPETPPGARGGRGLSRTVTHRPHYLLHGANAALFASRLAAVL